MSQNENTKTNKLVNNQFSFGSKKSNADSNQNIEQAFL